MSLWIYLVILNFLYQMKPEIYVQAKQEQERRALKRLQTLWDSMASESLFSKGHER